jgi:hypothetical protein
MIHSDETDRQSRRAFLMSGISLLGSGMVLATPALLSGCGDDKGTIGMVENPEDPTKKAKDSMNYYQQSKLKGAAPKHK